MAPSYTTQAVITLSILASSAVFWAFRKYVYTVITYEAPFERTKDSEQEVPWPNRGLSEERRVQTRTVYIDMRQDMPRTYQQ